MWRVLARYGWQLDWVGLAADVAVVVPLAGEWIELGWQHMGTGKGWPPTRKGLVGVAASGSGWGAGRAGCDQGGDWAGLAAAT
jgi:hypothetical protein